MGSQRKLFIVSVVALMASVYSANAADYIPEPPVVESPPAQHFGGGISVDHEALGVHAFQVGLRYQIW
jgi:hypothetical protein